MLDGMFLNGKWVSADHPGAARYMEVERKRQFDAKQGTREWKLEVLTSAAAEYLFGVSGSAVQHARLKGRIHSPVTLDVTGKPVNLIDLESAIEYWQSKKRLDFEDVLEDMRENGHLLAVRNTTYNVLHTRPFARFNDIALG